MDFVILEGNFGTESVGIKNLKTFNEWNIVGMHDAICGARRQFRRCFCYCFVSSFLLCLACLASAVVLANLGNCTNRQLILIDAITPVQRCLILHWQIRLGEVDSHREVQFRAEQGKKRINAMEIVGLASICPQRTRHE